MDHLRLFPRPMVPRAGVDRCWCLCHRDAEESPAPAVNRCCTPGVERRDALAAAAACDVCKRYHCLALAGRPPELDPVSRPYNPPPLVAVPQADGAGGEGPE